MEINHRREFLRTFVLAVASLVVVPQFAGADSASVTFIDIGPASQFAGAAWTKVVLPAKYAGAVIFVRRSSTKTALYEALSARCTHMGCTVAYVGDQHQFVCPCHHGRYDDNGANISGPPPSPLTALTTKLDAKKHLLVEAPPTDADSD